MSNSLPPDHLKRYCDLKSYWRNLFGLNVYKLPVDAGFTCPNRDGTIATGGCSYCDGRGSRLRQAGPLPSVTDQLLRGKAYYERYRRARKYIAYFQTFTNTYAPRDHLEKLWREALAVEDVVGLSLGARPDCLPEDTLGLIRELAEGCHLWLEFGLQSMHDETLRRINRGHTFACFLDALERAAGGKINICVHIIVGLPGETREEMLATARRLATLPIQGIKIHLLLALAGTALGEQYREGRITLPGQEEYVGIVCDILEILPPELVIQRLTADGYQDIFLAPAWARNKMAVLNA
ncbi:MAG: TIGR01212 family radical SAM protein, partial [Smithellaceae bacterium]|nr:TIGR01212 family radical SAM protein [Smithellaceae bacterium]